MSGASPLRVLVVDDNVDAALIQAALVRLWGHEVASCTRGSEAYEMAMNFRPDAILLDLGMPGVTGFDVLHRIQQQPDLQSVFVVALTGYGAPSDLEQTAAAGFDLHLVKPVPADLLKSILDGVRGTLQA